MTHYVCIEYNPINRSYLLNKCNKHDIEYLNNFYAYNYAITNDENQILHNVEIGIDVFFEEKYLTEKIIVAYINKLLSLNNNRMINIVDSYIITGSYIRYISYRYGTLYKYLQKNNKIIMFIKNNFMIQLKHDKSIYLVFLFIKN